MNKKDGMLEVIRGINHLGTVVKDMDEVAFLHPKSAKGILFGLAEKSSLASSK